MAREVKWKRVLSALAAGQRLNRFEAARMGDSCLNSTICKIQERGVPVRRRTISTSGYRGYTTYCCEYWLGPEGFAAAERILNGPEVGRA